MWKIVVLSLLLVVSQATNLENFLRTTWTLVAFYPHMGYVPACIEFYFEKVSHNSDCTCSDGNKATLVAGGYYIGKLKGQDQQSPVISIDSPSEKTVDVNCTCGSLHFTSRAVVREINNNYAIMHEKTPDTAYIFAKKVPRQADLASVLENVEDLKNESGKIMCATDILNATED